MSVAAKNAALYPTGRQQPHNMEAEQALLGVLMYENGKVAEVDGLVTPESFYDPVHGRIYGAVYGLVGAGMRADPITVADRLPADRGLDEMGGVRYLADLVDRSPPMTGAVTYAEVVREFWQRRELARIAEVMDKFAQSGELRPAGILEQAEAALLQIQLRGRQSGFVNAETAVARVLEQFENPEAASGVMTGLEPLDAEIGGWLAGELWLLAGRPGMGKSAVASSIALNIARHGRHADGRPLGVMTVNQEMNVEAMTRRHISDLAFELAPRDAPAYSRIRKRKIGDVEKACMYEAARQVAALKDRLQVIKTTGITLGRLRSLARRQVAAWSRLGIAPGLLVIDHAGLMRVDDPRIPRTEAQGIISQGLKDLSDELGIPILALVQLSRKVEERDDKRPHLSDLRDSGTWEQDADGVIFCYRDAYYAQRETRPKRADQVALWEERKASRTLEAILAKIREGESGTKDLWVDIARNAVRGHQPDNIFGGGMWSHEFERTAGLLGLSPPEPAPPAIDFSKLNGAAAHAVGSAPPDDAPPWDYDDGEFA